MLPPANACATTISPSTSNPPTRRWASWSKKPANRHTRSSYQNAVSTVTLSQLESTFIMGNKDARRIGGVSTHSFIYHSIGCVGLDANFAGEARGPSRFRWEGKRKLTESPREFPKASARRNPKGSLREAWERQPCAPAPSFTSRAQRNPIQFILVLGSVPLRCAPRTLGVLSIQPPPRKLRCVPFSGPLGFLSGAVA